MISVSRRPKVLVAAQDPGGAAALAPVAARLLKDGLIDVVIAATRITGPYFDRLGARVLTVEPLAELDDRALGSMRRLIAGESCEGVVIGTSAGPSIDKALTIVARERRQPSLGVLDAWMNYLERFGDIADPRALGYLPDYVSVMDSFARDEMLELGFPSERLLVTGHPAFDRLLCENAGETRAAQRRRMRKELGIDEGAFVIFFPSQPLTQFYGSADRALHTLGYTEAAVLNDLRIAVSALVESGQPARLVIAPHPLQRDPDSFGASDGAVVPQHLTGSQASLAADVVVGMSTTLLVETFLQDIPTISYQPGLRVRDPFVLTRAGVLRRVENLDSLNRNLQSLAAGDWHPPTTARLWQPGASARVASQLYEMMRIADGPAH